MFGLLCIKNEKERRALLLSDSSSEKYYKNAKDCKADDCRWLECECEDDFEKLLQSFKYCWVKINRGGPEKVEGILQDVSCEFVTLIVKRRSYISCGISY